MEAIKDLSFSVIGLHFLKNFLYLLHQIQTITHSIMRIYFIIFVLPAIESKLGGRNAEILVQEQIFICSFQC